MNAHPTLPPGLADDGEHEVHDQKTSNTARRPTVKVFRDSVVSTATTTTARQSVSSVSSIDAMPPGLEKHISRASNVPDSAETKIDAMESAPSLIPIKSLEGGVVKERRDSLKNKAYFHASASTVTSEDADASKEAYENWSQNVRGSFPYVRKTPHPNGESKANLTDDQLEQHLTERLETLSELKRTFEAKTQKILAEKIREFHAQIEAEMVRGEEYKQKAERFFDSVKKWVTPMYARRSALVSECQLSRARLRGLVEGIEVQRQGMQVIDKVSKEQIDLAKDKLKRVHRNTDALARSLGIVETEKPHNEYLELSIYLWQKYLSDVTQACMQASSEFSSKDADVDQFKASELKSLVHQSKIELQLQSENIDRENAVLAKELEKAGIRDTGSTHRAQDLEHERVKQSVASLEKLRNSKTQALESLESRLGAMKHKRGILQREFQELSLALKALWPSNDVSVNIAEQQLRMIEAVDEQRKHLQSSFRERLDTVMAETKLAEEVKWRNRIETAQLSTERAVAENRARKKDQIETAVSDIGNRYQDEFEDRVAKLRLEKDEHARLVRVRSARLNELTSDLGRIEELKQKHRQVHERKMEKHRRLQSLKERFRQRWHRGDVSSETAEKFLLRVQWTMNFTPKIIETCRESMRTLRAKLPLIRSCRADIRQRERILRQVTELQKYVANPFQIQDATLAALRQLDLVLPDPRSSAGAQHLEFEALKESLKQTYDDLVSELMELDAKLISDIAHLERASAGYIFMHKGLEYKEVVRRQDDTYKRAVKWAAWENKMRSKLPRLRGAAGIIARSKGRQ